MVKRYCSEERWKPADRSPRLRTWVTGFTLQFSGRGWLLLWLGVLAPAASLAAQVPDAAPTELLLAVHVNQQDEHETELFLQTQSGEFWVAADSLRQWRVSLPKVRPMSYAGADYYPLSAFVGSRFRIDAATQTVWITLPPAAFATTVIAGLSVPSGPPQPSPPGAFLNYDLFGSHNSTSTTANAFTELGLFDRLGVLTDSYTGNALNTAAANWLRLETTFTQDHPDDIATLRLGDATTAGGMTGTATRFAGVQWATNFATRPGLVTLPVPGVSGVTAAPSTVQLYVNGVLQRTQDVQPGPFSLPQVPIVSGPGLVTLVVRDLSGHQQIINVPYYGATSLLADGLDDYSFSLGKERENFGLESDSYGPLLADAVFDRGFTDSFTGELRGQLMPGQQVLGLGAGLAAGRGGVFELAGALSHSDLGTGRLGVFGYQYTGLKFSASLQVQRADAGFIQSGYPTGIPGARRQESGSAGMFLGAAGSLSLSYVHQVDPVLGEMRFAGLDYTKSLGQAGFLSLSVFHDLTGKSGNTALLSVILPFGPQRSVSVGVSHQEGVSNPFAEVQQSLPAGTGWGYRLGAELGKDGQSDGELDYQDDVGSYSLQALHTAGDTLYQGSVDGAVGYLGGDFFASRQLTDSFAVVEVPGQADVGVYAQNQVVARTDGRGYAIIPLLNAYQDNEIGFDPRNLPLDTDISTTNMTVVPYYRSGVLARFDVKTVRGVTFTVKLPGGTSLPAGALLQVPGQVESFPVGYDGEAYVTGLTSSARIRASWGDKACAFTIELPAASTDPLPDLGVVTCTPVAP